MAFLFAKPLTPAEQLKKHKREIDRAIRDLERERSRSRDLERRLGERERERECRPIAVRGAPRSPVQLSDAPTSKQEGRCAAGGGSSPPWQSPQSQPA